MSSDPARSRTLAALSLAAALGACDSSSRTDGSEPAAFADPIGDTAVTVEEPGNDTDVRSGSASRFGLVEIAQPAGALDDGYVAASFVRFAAPRGYDRLIADLLPPLDGCRVTRTDPSAGADALDEDDVEAGERIGAGETITLRNAAGTWLTLDRDAEFSIQYINERELPSPLPRGLVLDIPGDGFPAFSDVPVRDVTPVAGASVGEAASGPDDTFRWDAPDEPNETVLVRIDVLGLDESGTITEVDCLATDDGEFALPAEIRADLVDDFSVTTTLARLGITALRRGDALLLVTVESAAD